MECSEDRAKIDVLAKTAFTHIEVLRTYIVTNFLFVKIFLCTMYTLQLNGTYFSYLFNTFVELMVAGTLGKNRRPPVLKYSNGQ